MQPKLREPPQKSPISHFLEQNDMTKGHKRRSSSHKYTTNRLGQSEIQLLDPAQYTPTTVAKGTTPNHLTTNSYR
jgi:hypothetical protein